MNTPITLGELANKVNAELHGDADVKIFKIATLASAKTGEISFLTKPSYRKYLADSQASAIILSQESLDACQTNALVSDNPYACFARVATVLNPPPIFEGAIDPSAVVDPSANIDPTAWIGPNAVIEADVSIAAKVFIGPCCVIKRGSQIGANSRLISNIAICSETIIGKRALIQPGAVIGSDGFGLAMDKGKWIRIPQIGSVVIGDDVEVGACTTIDRGALGNTRIENDARLDNLIQVAHNAKIGAHTAMAGCTGIAGSSKIGEYCTVAGGAGIAGHLEIADNVHITAMSFVSSSIKERGQYSGMPLDSNKNWRKNAVRFKQLDDLAKRIRNLEKMLEK